MVSRSSPAIGIDLGTTFSCVSVYRNGRTELIPNADGNRLTPSIVYFDPTTGDVSVGQIADELSPQFPKNCLLDSKRFIGRRYDDEFVSRYISTNQSDFFLVCGDNEQCAFEVEINGEKLIKKPEEVSAEILKFLKQTASDYLDEAVTCVVISVPAYFSNAQRKATKKAAELAGLEVLKLITEPTTAAIYYISEKHRDNSNVLVFDFGGGTLDVSLIMVNESIFEVKSVYGDTLLGGRNFDEILFQHFYNDTDFANNAKLLTTNFKRRFSKMCVNLKKSLSLKDKFTYFYDEDLNISLSRSELEKMTVSIFQRMMDVVELCVEDSGLHKSDIDEVVLVGGSTRIPKVKQQLSSYFGAAKIKSDLNPDEAVAAGASIQAALLLNEDKDLEKYKVTEVTPMALGIRTYGDLMDVFIPRNSPLPATYSHLTTTVFNNQTTVDFSIYEGERKNTKYNNKLGEFSITDLSRKRAGCVIITVNFDLDENGILKVSATENSTGKCNDLEVTMGQFHLSNRMMKTSIIDARRYKIEDEIFEKFVIFKDDLQMECNHVMYDLKKISSKSEKQFVKKCCEQFLKDSDALHFTESDKLEEMFEVYKSSISPILKKYSMDHLEDF